MSEPREIRVTLREGDGGWSIGPEQVFRSNEAGRIDFQRDEQGITIFRVLRDHLGPAEALAFFPHSSVYSVIVEPR